MPPAPQPNGRIRTISKSVTISVPTAEDVASYVSIEKVRDSCGSLLDCPTAIRDPRAPLLDRDGNIHIRENASG